MRFCASLLVALATFCSARLPAQTHGATGPQETVDAPSAATLVSRSTLVLVPALIRKKSGELVFSLKADDFVLTDDGIPQKLHLDEDTGSEPLALVVDIEGGGAGTHQIAKYGALSSMIDSIVGGEPHEVAVVGYDSSPVLVQDFTPDVDVAGRAIEALIADDNGDEGAATLDSLAYAVDLLRKQPVSYRRVILLISESNDYGSKATLAEALRAISDTNTVIYSVGFSSARNAFAREAIKGLGSSSAGPAHGCMSRDPNDPNVNLQQKPASQAYDGLALLAPPLALAKAAVIAAFDGLKKNIPQTVARLTGGEYFKLGKQKNFERDLQTISNHIPNRYILSFQPQAPHPGPHLLTLSVPNATSLDVTARSSYWADSTVSPDPH